MPKGVVTDEAGVQLAIEHNQGKLVEVNFPERGRRNGNVKIVVPGLNFDQLPAFDTRDLALCEDLTVLRDKLAAVRKEAVDAAVAEGRDPVAAAGSAELWVAYRTHVVRDDKLVAPDVPFDSIPSDAKHRHKRLMGIAEDRTPAAQALLVQAEFECKAGRLGAQRAAQVDERPNLPAPAPEPMRSGGTQADTWAFTAAVAMTTWAFEMLEDSGRTFTARHVGFLAERLTRLADSMQTHLTGAAPNRNANSHTRVRGVLHSVIDKRFPPPCESDDPEVWEKWEADVHKTGVGLLNIARQVHGQ